MKLLIHACCADCLLKILQSRTVLQGKIVLIKDIEEIVIYYYNPNIHPRSEYQSRLKAMQLMFKDIKLIIPDWKPSEWFEKQNPSKSPFDPPSLKLRTDKQDGKSNQNPPGPTSSEPPSLEKGGLKKSERCPKCWELRLGKTAEFAKKNGFEAFSSTLLTSEYQDSEKIKEIGQKIAKKYGIDFLIPKNICKKLETKGFYKQVFCGCCYSLTERFEEKY